MNMRHLLRDNGKKIMAVVSAVLMITFFLPSLRSGGSGNQLANHVVATIYGGEKLTARDTTVARQEWDLLRHHVGVTTQNQQGEDQQENLAEATLGPVVVQQMDASPNSFLLLIKEAQHLGVYVSTDQYQTELGAGILGLPDETDSNYDLSRQAVHDLLLVKDLVDRLADDIKVSQPRQLRILALFQEEVSLQFAQLSVQPNMAATTQPTDQQVTDSYQLYKSVLPGQITDSNPLGFGYCLPDRVKMEYIGFNRADLLRYVKGSKPAIEWETLARRLYRTHTADFPVPTAGPSSQPVFTVGTPEWENLPPEVAAKVFDQVYDTATNELAKKIVDRMTDETASDWAVYQEDVSKGVAPPLAPVGAVFNSPDYIRKLAASLQNEIGPMPSLGLIENGFKSADDLALLEDIGPSVQAEGLTFAHYATEAGDQFKPAQALPQSARLALWQPSLPVYSGAATSPTGVYIFRLTAMDPSHPMSLDDCKAQVSDDLRLAQAWKATLDQANKLLDQAKHIGVEAAVHDVVPRPTVVSSDFFSINTAGANDQIPGLPLKPGWATALARSAADQLLHAVSGERSAAVVKFPADRCVALVELKGVKANWMDDSDRMTRQTMLAAEDRNAESTNFLQQWVSYDALVKRTQYQEAGKTD
jgi:hypothetical protein